MPLYRREGVHHLIRNSTSNNHSLDAPGPPRWAFLVCTSQSRTSVYFVVQYSNAMLRKMQKHDAVQDAKLDRDERPAHLICIIIGVRRLYSGEQQCERLSTQAVRFFQGRAPASSNYGRRWLSRKHRRQQLIYWWLCIECTT